MTALLEKAEFPTQVSGAVRQAIEETLATILGEKPRPREQGSQERPVAAVAGIISFAGDPNWSLALILPEETAPELARKFAGFDIPFDSPDMGDVVGELANVLAGDVVARLESRGIKAAMTLPTVTRGHDMEMILPRSLAACSMAYQSAQGPFWFRLTAASGGGPGRKPGT